MAVTHVEPPEGEVRLRDAFRDEQAAIYLAGMLAWASMVGVTPIAVREWSLSPTGMGLYMTVCTAILLVMMYMTDRRLREVNHTCS